MPKPLWTSVAFGTIILLGVACGEPDTRPMAASTIATVAATTATTIATATPGVDPALADATGRATRLDPHALLVVDTHLSGSEAQSAHIPFAPGQQQGRMIGFKGDFVESGFPGADGKTRMPFVFFIYDSDGRFTGWSFQDAATARTWGAP